MVPGYHVAESSRVKDELGVEAWYYEQIKGHPRWSGAIG